MQQDMMTKQLLELVEEYQSRIEKQNGTIRKQEQKIKEMEVLFQAKEVEIESLEAAIMLKEVQTKTLELVISEKEDIFNIQNRLIEDLKKRIRELEERLQNQ